MIQKHFIFWPIKNVAKQFAVDVLSAVLILALGSFIGMNETSYIGWIFMAVKVAVCAFFNYGTDKPLAFIEI